MHPTRGAPTRRTERFPSARLMLPASRRFVKIQNTADRKHEDPEDTKNRIK